MHSASEEISKYSFNSWWKFPLQPRSIIIGCKIKKCGLCCVLPSGLTAEQGNAIQWGWTLKKITILWYRMCNLMMLLLQFREIQKVVTFCHKTFTSGDHFILFKQMYTPGLLLWGCSLLSYCTLHIRGVLQLSNLWWMRNPVCKGFGSALRSGSRKWIQWPKLFGPCFLSGTPCYCEALKTW